MSDLPPDDARGADAPAEHAITVGQAVDAWGSWLDRRLRWGTLALAVLVGTLVVTSAASWGGKAAAAPRSTAAAAVACYLAAVAMCVLAGWLSLRMVGRRGNAVTLLAALGSAALTILSAPVAGVARDLLG